MYYWKKVIILKVNILDWFAIIDGIVESNGLCLIFNDLLLKISSLQKNPDFLITKTLNNIVVYMQQIEIKFMKYLN